MVNQYNLFEYIETSALEYKNVDKLFRRLAITALLDYKPRVGEIVDTNHVRFKILLVGAAAVGKSTLINSFVTKKFEENYKITIAIDLMTQNLEITEEEIPKEVLEFIKKSFKSVKKKFRRIRKKGEIDGELSELTEEMVDEEIR